ncbi:MAG: hypothetical protein ABJN36_02640 [Cyclobacteriaceae bacterium]
MTTKTLTDKLAPSRVLIFNSRYAEVAALLGTMRIYSAFIDEGESICNNTMAIPRNVILSLSKDK